MVVKSLIWAFLPNFLWSIILLCLVLSAYLVYLRILPCAHAPFSQDGSSQEVYEQLGITPLSTSKEQTGREGLLGFENDKYVVSYLLSGQGLASSLSPAIFILEYRPTGKELQLLTLGGLSVSCFTTGSDSANFLNTLFAVLWIIAFSLPTHILCVCVCLCVQSRQTPCSSQQPASSVDGIFQARILEWVAISYSKRLP